MPDADAADVALDLVELATLYRFAGPDLGASWEAKADYLRGVLDEAAGVVGLMSERTGIGAETDVDVTANELGDEAGRTVAAALANLSELTDPVRLGRETLARALVTAYTIAARGGQLYLMPADRALAFAQRAGLSDLNADELRADYTRRLGIGRAILSLASSGVLDLVFGTSGRRRTGAAPLALIAIAAVAALAAVAYVLVHYYEVAATNERWRVTCLDEQGDLIPAYRDLCVELSAKQTSDWLDKAATALPWVAGAAAIVAVVSWFRK